MKFATLPPTCAPGTAAIRLRNCARYSIACTKRPSANVTRHGRRQRRPSKPSRTSAADLTHIFLGAARSLQIPARYLAGYLCGRAEPEGGGHAWAEAYVPGLGWVGFDTVNCVCPADAYVRVAVGLDALGAAPVRAAPVTASATKARRWPSGSINNPLTGVRPPLPQ